LIKEVIVDLEDVWFGGYLVWRISGLEDVLSVLLRFSGILYISLEYLKYYIPPLIFKE
jgi:hypothetical protein